jgi:hypothetical protein
VLYDLTAENERTLFELLRSKASCNSPCFRRKIGVLSTNKNPRRVDHRELIELISAVESCKIAFK